MFGGVDLLSETRAYRLAFERMNTSLSEETWPISNTIMVTSSNRNRWAFVALQAKKEQTEPIELQIVEDVY